VTHTLKKLVLETCTEVLFGASFLYQFLERVSPVLVLASVYICQFNQPVTCPTAFIVVLECSSKLQFITVPLLCPITLRL